MASVCVMPFAFKGGQIVPKEQATVSVASHSLQYGSTCFAGIRGYIREGKVRIFRLRDHHERLMKASKIMGFGFFISYEDFEEIIARLIELNRPESDFYIRPFLYSENEVIGVGYNGLKFDLAVYMIPLKSYYSRDKGLRFQISSWQKIPDAAMSTKAKAGGCYVNSSMATTDARACGYDEALMMDHNQNIVEASVANLFIVYRGEIFTPPVGADVLEGITMRTVIDLLEAQGYKIRYEPISRSMVYSCDELFLTGTAAGVIFGESVDGRVIGDGKEGPMTARIRKEFQSLIEMEHPRSKEWVREFLIEEVCLEAYSHI
jgi:branched-chain amino acid aminotransferase